MVGAAVEDDNESGAGGVWGSLFRINPVYWSLGVIAVTSVLWWWRFVRDFAFGSCTTKRNSAGAANNNAAKKEEELSNNSNTNNTSNTIPALEDLRYLVRVLRPDSTHWEILTAVLSTPDSLAWSDRDVARVRAARSKRHAQLEHQPVTSTRPTATTTKTNSADDRHQQPNEKTTTDYFDDLVNEGGWDESEDDSNDETDTVSNSRAATSSSSSTTTTTSALLSTNSKERAQREIAAEKEKEDRLRAVKEASGEGITVCEGLDEGVLGQAWVERTLTAAGVWPPTDLGVLSSSKALPTTATTNSNSTTSSKTTIDANANKNLKNSHLPPLPLEHDGMRRMLCMTVGRLNSVMLNSHVELLDAGSRDKIDQTYFQATMEFRNRVSMLLDACLRIAVTLRSQQLLATLVETVAMFKIGVKCSNELFRTVSTNASDNTATIVASSNGKVVTFRDRAIPWFNAFMTRQYGILPRLKILSRTIRRATNSTDVTSINENSTGVESTLTDKNNTPSGSTPTTSSSSSSSTSGSVTAVFDPGDGGEILLDLERIHAQQFLKVKVEQLEKQGIPPAVGLQTYREVWWFTLRVTKKKTDESKDTNSAIQKEVDEDDIPPKLPWASATDEEENDPSDWEAFRCQDPAYRLLTAWPMSITNIAQQRGKMKIQFVAPTVPGHYVYTVAIHSLDFFGADTELEFDVTVNKDSTKRNAEITLPNNSEGTATGDDAIRLEASK